MEMNRNNRKYGPKTFIEYDDAASYLLKLGN